LSHEYTALSERERQYVELVAAQRGITFEEAVSQLAKEALANRVRLKTGKRPAKVIQLPKR
jgi:hypothetical protein